jgi:hypothetical protein
MPDILALLFAVAFLAVALIPARACVLARAVTVATAIAARETA